MILALLVVVFMATAKKTKSEPTKTTAKKTTAKKTTSEPAAKTTTRKAKSEPTTTTATKTTAKKTKSESISSSEEISIILKYLTNQNRPYSATDIFNNLHEKIGKTALQKHLNTLVEQDLITCKAYGKQSIYFAKQVGTAIIVFLGKPRILILGST